MKTNTEYKNLALQSLEGNWGKGITPSLVYAAITVALSIVAIILDSDENNYSGTIFNFASILLLPLNYGIFVFYLNIYRRNNPTVGSIFDGFTSNYGKYFLTLLLQEIYTCLWTLLLIVPGIIKSYSYSMTCFVMKDNPQLKNNAAIEESMRIMDGHKMQLFLLDLSMIGWALLSCLTLGLGFIFLLPYYYTAHAAFYEDLKAKEEAGVADVTFTI